MSKTVNQLAITATTQAVRVSTRHAWSVILAFLLVALLSAVYFTSHFAITTDSNNPQASRGNERIMLIVSHGTRPFD